MSMDAGATVAQATIPARPAPATARGDNAHVGRPLLIAAFVLLVALYAFSVDHDLIARYGPRILWGLVTTIQLVLTAVALGGLLALPLAFARLSRNRIIGPVAYAYSYFFRGTPLLAQIFLFYYGAGQFRSAMETLGVWWILRDPYTCAVLAFTLNTAAYQSEIYKGAISAVARGQWEGGRALGLRDVTIFFKVVLPQAAITALRPLGNEIIFMIKGSAIASIITVYDLMGETRLAFSRTYNFEVYLWAAALYLVIVEVLRRGWDMLETRLTRHLVR